MLPNQAGRADHALNIEEYQRLVRLGADALVYRVAAVMGNAVHTQEPAVLTVYQYQLAAVVLERRIAGCHIVAHRLDVAGTAHVHQRLLTGHGVGRQDDTTIFGACDVLQHLALTAAGCTLVHDNQFVIVLGDHSAA